MSTTISALIGRDRVVLPLRSSTKAGVIDEMIDRLVRVEGREDLREAIREAVWARENEISTGIGRGIAIPHAEIDADFGASAVLGVHPEGVDFDALDSGPVFTVFLLTCPRSEDRARLGILSRLSRLFGEAEVRKALRRASSEDEVVAIIREHEGDG
jgi:PTS system fructose-specific IIC component